MYGGGNGSKIAVMYDGDLYMIKFPSYAKMNPNMSYANSCISEYIGCKIFNSVDMLAQDVLLGTYNKDGINKLVVACKDFTVYGAILQDFASLKNTIIDSVHGGYGTDLRDVLYTIRTQKKYNSVELEKFFWDMFIIDAFIGNWDRHNGNWGFLYNPITDKLELAPIYDCGSSLFPQADNNIAESIITDKNALNDRIFNRPLSALTIDGKRINYFNFISSLSNEMCNEALLRMVPKINMDCIYKIIENTPGLSSLQIEFYKTILTARKQRILDFSYEKLVSERSAHDVKPMREF